MAVGAEGGQYEGGHVMENWPEQGDFRGFGLGNAHIIVESDEEHCRGRGDAVTDLYDAVKGVVAALGFCQDLTQEKVLLKQTFRAPAL